MTRLHVPHQAGAVKPVAATGLDRMAHQPQADRTLVFGLSLLDRRRFEASHELDLKPYLPVCIDGIISHAEYAGRLQQFCRVSD